MHIEAGLLFDVRLNGTWVGYVGVKEDTQLGLNACSIQELILAPQGRGRGYGRAPTTLLARHLPGPSRVLLGSIDAADLGAVRAALLSWRRDVGAGTSCRLADRDLHLTATAPHEVQWLFGCPPRVAGF